MCTVTFVSNIVFFCVGRKSCNLPIYVSFCIQREEEQALRRRRKCLTQIKTYTLSRIAQSVGCP